ncbi:MAG: ATP-binding protein [Cyanophyceae cyanobacterium]
MAGVLQPVRQLLGLTKSVTSFDDEQFKEADYLQKYRETPYHLAWFYSVKIRHAYLFESVEQFEALISKTEIIVNTVPTHAKVPSTTFYVVLMHLKLIEISDREGQKQRHWEAIAPLEAKLQEWQKDAPGNISHKYALVQAEKSRLLGNIAEAINFYEQSIAQATEQGYGYEAALANELASKFYQGWGKGKVASGYMQDAYYGYSHWEACAKLTELESRYPDLLQPILRQETSSFNLLNTLTAPVRTPSIQGSRTTHHRSTSTGLGDALDLVAVLRAAQALSQTIVLDELMAQLTQIILQNSGGDRCALILPNDLDEWQVRVIATPEEIQLHTASLNTHTDLPIKLIQYAKNTQEIVVINNLVTDLPVLDSYLNQRQPKSVLALPILTQGRCLGILVLENRLTSGVFAEERLSILNFLCTQAAISLENAQLYWQAKTALTDLQQAQLQLVQSEKMSTLGSLVSGVAHEVNNPLGFLEGNIQPAQEYVQDLLALVELYQQKIANPDLDIEKEVEDLDFEFIQEDLPKLIGSMGVGISRIRGISTSLRTFSRTDQDEKVDFNLHEGIDSTLLILKHRTKANENRPEIQVVKDYADLPEIQCFPGQLNQAFMNILANAIDAFDEANQGKTYQEIEASPNVITIQTLMLDDQVQIRIEDNGCGMDEETAQRIFEQGFTTKGVGKGTGLGMAISHQIITEKHGGTITCFSNLGEGSIFKIVLPI